MLASTACSSETGRSNRCSPVNGADTGTVEAFGADARRRQQPVDEVRIEAHAVTTISTRWNSFVSL